MCSYLQHYHSMTSGDALSARRSVWSGGHLPKEINSKGLMFGYNNVIKNYIFEKVSLFNGPPWKNLTKVAFISHETPQTHRIPHYYDKGFSLFSPATAHNARTLPPHKPWQLPIVSIPIHRSAVVPFDAIQRGLVRDSVNQGCTNFAEIWEQLQDSRCQKGGRMHINTENPQMLVATAIWPPGFVHPCI